MSILYMSSWSFFYNLIFSSLFTESLSLVSFVGGNFPVVFETKENEPINRTIGILEASDGQTGKQIIYELQCKNTIKLLEIDPVSGRISNVVKLDFEQNKVLQCTASAYTKDAILEKAIRQVLVQINNINDNSPIFEQSIYSVHVKEDLDAGGYVAQITALDADQTDRITYAFTNGKDGTFSVDEYAGIIRTKTSLDYEIRKQYKLNMSATDGEQTAYTTVLIDVDDVDDQGAAFDKSVYYAELNEGIYINKTFLIQVHAFDLDFGINASVVYKVLHESVGGINIFMNDTTGKLFVSGILDHEERSSIRIQISAESVNQPSAQSLVILKIKDINDNKPTFTSQTFSGKISENSITGTSILRVTAYDNDEGNNSALIYRIANTEAVPFLITEEGDVQVNGSLDRETKDFYILKVVVKESLSKEAYHNETLVYIEIIDANDNTPVFPVDTIQLSVKENELPPVMLTQFNATDQDTGTNSELQYSIQSDVSDVLNDFSVNSTTGVLSTSNILDKEKVPKYNFQIKVTDLAPVGGRRSSFMSVTIDVIDENDHAPKFIQTFYYADIIEAVTPNTIIASVKATDKDSGKNSIIHYSILSGSEGIFVVNKFSGVITSVALLDREHQHIYNMTIRAQDGGGKSSLCYVIIHILDINDNRPIFSQPFGYTFNITENKTDAFVGVVKATDKDYGKAGLVVYGISDNNMFRINSTSGEIFTNIALDRELMDMHIFSIYAKDSAVDFRSTYVQVSVSVHDINDNSPVFKDSKKYVTTIYKGVAPWTTIFTFVASDADTGVNMEIQYDSPNIPDYLHLDNKTGDLKITSKIPDDVQMFKLNVIASNNVFPFHNDTAVLELVVMSVVADAPIFNKQMFKVSIMENEPIGTVIIDLNATYKNQPEKKNFIYSLQHGGSETFAIHQQRGIITTTKVLDHETVNNYKLVVSVSLKGQTNANFASVEIQVQDQNDNAPLFSTSISTLFLRENINELYQLPQLHCTDKDFGKNADITYSIEGTSLLSVDPLNGKILLKEALDYELIQEFNITVKCENNNSDPLLSSTQNITVRVLDKNDNTPQFIQSMYHINITENNKIGIDLVKVQATDKDRTLNGNIKYSIVSIFPSVSCFSVDTATGQVYVECVLDRELHANYKITISAADYGSPSLSSNANVDVTVLDQNDNTPHFEKSHYRFEVSENSGTNYNLGTITVLDADVDSPCQYCVVLMDTLVERGYFEVKTNGDLYLLKPLNHEVKSVWTFKVRAYREKPEGPVTEGAQATVIGPKIVLTTKPSIDLGSSQSILYVEASVIVTVLDVNEYSPFFMKSAIYTGIENTSPSGTVVIDVKATDKDSSTTNQYYIASRDHEGKFKINTKTGRISTAKSLFLFVNRKFDVIVGCNDGGVPSNPSSNQAKLHIFVFDRKSIGIFLTSQSSSHIQDNLSDLEMLLSNLTHGHAKVYQVIQTGTVKSKIEFYAIDTLNMRMFLTEELKRLVFNPKTRLLQQWSAQWNITDITAPITPAKIKSVDETDLFIGIIIGISVLVLIITIIAINLWLKGNRSHKRVSSPQVCTMSRAPLPPAYKEPRDDGSMDRTHNRYYIETYESTNMYDTVRYVDENLSRSFYSDHSPTLELTDRLRGEDNESYQTDTLRIKSGLKLNYPNGETEVDNIVASIDELFREKLKLSDELKNEEIISIEQVEHGKENVFEANIVRNESKDNEEIFQAKLIEIERNNGKNDAQIVCNVENVQSTSL